MMPLSLTTHPDGVEAGLQRPLGVLRSADSLDCLGPVPLAAQPGGVLPAEGGVELLSNETGQAGSGDVVVEESIPDTLK